MKEFLKGVGLVGAAVLCAIGKAVEIERDSKVEIVEEYDYPDAIKAIVESDLPDYYKYTIMDTVSKGENSAYYKAVITLLNSEMSGYYILKAISKL